MVMYLREPRCKRSIWFTQVSGYSSQTSTRWVGYTLGRKITYNPRKVEFKFSGKILLAKSTFSSYLRLASTMGHELMHAINYVNGNMTKWYKEGGESYRESMSEYESYNWEDNYGGSSNCSKINSCRWGINKFMFN